MADAIEQLVPAIAAAAAGATAARVLLVGDANQTERYGRALPSLDLTAVAPSVLADMPQAPPYDCVAVLSLFPLHPPPAEFLPALRRRLVPGGTLLAAFPNARTHRRLATWLRDGSFPRDDGVRALADAYRALLDADLSPEPVDRVLDPVTPALLAALRPALDHLGLHAGRARFHLETAAWIVRATPLPTVGELAAEPVTVSVCLSDPDVFRANLAASPDLAVGHRHEVLTWPGCPNAAAGHNQALARARHAWVLCAHQDVYLPCGWLARFQEAIRRAEASFGRLDVVGVYGVATHGGAVTRAGHVIDRDRRLFEPASLPRLVSSLDELLLAVRADAGLRLDPALGWHLYGTDLCLAAQARGGQAAVVEAPCLHDQQAVELPTDFHASAGYLARKWPARLPLGTPCLTLRSSG